MPLRAAQELSNREAREKSSNCETAHVVAGSTMALTSFLLHISAPLVTDLPRRPARHPCIPFSSVCLVDDVIIDVWITIISK